MDAYSRFRRSVSKLIKTSTTTAAASSSDTNKSSKDKLQEEEEEKLYGITEQLIEFIKSFCLDTFKNFSLPDERKVVVMVEILGMYGRISLSGREKHAMLVLSRVKELAQLRFRLCPRYLKERQFWRIYFTLVRSYVAEYELNAVRLAKLKQIRTESDTVSKSNTYEVEMSEAKFTSSMESAPSTEQK